MFDGNSTFYDLFDIGGSTSPWTCWRGAGTNTSFNQGMMATTDRIVPMPIKTDLTPRVSYIFRSPVVT